MFGVCKQKTKENAEKKEQKRLFYDCCGKQRIEQRIKKKRVLLKVDRSFILK